MLVNDAPFVSSLKAAVMSVSMNPGATAFTRMLRGASSLASDFVSPTSPHIEAAELLDDPLDARLDGGEFTDVAQAIGAQPAVGRDLRAKILEQR